MIYVRKAYIEDELNHQSLHLMNIISTKGFLIFNRNIYKGLWCGDFSSFGESLLGGSKVFFETLFYTPSVPICLSFIPFWDIQKYCLISKNRSHWLTNVLIIPLLYFQNYLKRKLTNIFFFLNQSSWSTLLVASLRITLLKNTDKFT